MVNQVKEALKNKMRSLMTAEGAAQFNAQILLLSQTATNYLDMSDSPEKCDEYFNNILNQRGSRWRLCGFPGIHRAARPKT